MGDHICNICGEKFENHSLKANHIRWKHKDQSIYVEKITNIKKQLDNNRLGDLKEFKVECKNCNNDFVIVERENKYPSKKNYFCCVSCANKYSSSFRKDKHHSIETRKKISILSKEFWRNRDYSDKVLKNKRFSSKGEREIRTLLKERYGYKNVSAHYLIELNNIRKSTDMFIKDRNIIIEYDGIWHFNQKIYERMGEPEKYKEVIEKDKMVNEYCKINNIRLLRISDDVYKKNKKLTLTNIIKFIEEEKIFYKELYH